MDLDYGQLKTKAKELGLKYHKITRKELEASVKTELIKRGELKETDEPKKELKDISEVIPNEEKKNPVDIAPDLNAAIILRGTTEVRRYTRSTHGKDFAELARNYAMKNKLSVDYITEAPIIRCPSCGVKID